VKRISSVLRAIAGFGISDVEPMGSINKMSFI
jgi:hypothetical protein